MPMNLAIDVGNTSAKAALFDKEKLIKRIEGLDESSLKAVLLQEKIENIIISSVNTYSEQLLSVCALPQTSRHIPIFKLNYQLPLPIQILYQTPQTLGMDRVAAVVGATIVCPNANSLVVDAGTCITFDFIDASKNYHGGAITLGVAMRFKALHEFTDKLPLFSKANFDATRSFIGKSTESSIVNGVVYGVAHEVQGMAEKYISEFGKIDIVFCGGDASFLYENCKENLAKFPTNVWIEQDLLFLGLNQILLYNLLNQNYI
jgi:type III pantothenate kinase